MQGTIQPMMYIAIFPEICVLVLTLLVLGLDLMLPNQKRNSLGWITAAGLAIIAILMLVFAQPLSEPQLLWGGMVRLDGAAFIFKIIFLIGAALTVLFSIQNPDTEKQGAYYILLLISVFGMCLMASAADLIMLYLAIETTSIPLYVLAGFLIRDQKSVESGIKYLLFGAMTSAIMLYGFSLLYGLTGSTQLYEIANVLRMSHVPIIAVATSLILVLAGFSFKVSAFPFHFWAPDVYEGAPTPVAGFLSTASKAAGFAVLMRVLPVVFPETSAIWSVLIGAIATASMFTGNLLALAQKNIKRVLAYSSIAQAGFILIGVAADSQLGTSGAVYYLMAYLVTNLAAFGIVAVVGRVVGSDELSSYAGLSRRSPVLALSMLVALLSLGGIPPFAGFTVKLLVIAAAVQSNMVWLAFIGVLNSIIALYYYLNVLKVIYLYHSEDETKALGVPRVWVISAVFCMLGVILLGTLISPWFGWASDVASSLITH